MSIAGLSFQLSMTQAQFLIDHIDTMRPVSHNKNEDATRSGLIWRQLIRYEINENIVNRPRCTVLTDRGRDAVCAILGHYADEIVRAHDLARDRMMLSVASAIREQRLRTLMEKV